MSSHREAPQISKDPTADSTDVYAFVSPDKPSTVTLIANYIPLQAPDGGPNFYEFADDVLYSINIDNTGDGQPDIAFQFQFTTVNNIPGSFLYNDGPITALTGSGASLWNRQQTYKLTQVNYTYGSNGANPTATSTVLGTGLPVPPCNIGPLSTPNYASALAAAAIQNVGNNITAFAGQRAEGFYVDLGAVFDLGGLRGFEGYHVGGPMAGLMNGMPGVNSTSAVNVHSLALQVPISQLTSSSGPSIGVWTSAYRQKVRVTDGNATTGDATTSGPYTQVSRLGNPLVNELIIGLGDKDYWNAVTPPADGGSRLYKYFENPLLGQLLPALYTSNGTASGSTLFPNLQAYNNSPTLSPPRLDLVATLLLGIPAGVVNSTFTNQIGSSPVPADMLRLNTAQAPTTSNPSNLGVLGGDLAGFPNGRRVFDDVATIELRAVAGAILGLVTKAYNKPTYTPDAAAGEVDFSLTSSSTDTTAMGTEHYLPSFPYLGTPYSGYSTPNATPVGYTTVPGTND